MSAPPSKEVRAHLLVAKTALASGDAARARASCRSALALDDTSYDAWVFDGKAAFACGDAESALASYRVAAGVRDDHPAAWRGALEAAEAVDDFSVAADAMAKLLNLPEDEKQVTRERRAEWNARLARTLRRLGRWADAAARFTAAATWPDPTPSRRERTAAFLEAAECALEEDAERAKTAGKEAIETASRRTIVSPAESRAMAAAAARAHFARPNPALESAVRTFLEATKDDEGDDANRAHRVRGVLLARASARLALARGADAAGAAALDALREAETLVFSSRGDRRSVIGHRSDVVRAARDAALEAVAALDAGWDVEEEGWAAERAFAEESEALALRAAPLVALVPADAPRTSEPAAIVARVWLRLSDPRGPGRGGRVANVPGSAAGAEMLPERDRDALRDALRDATEPTLVRAADEANAAADAGTLGLGAAILGWGALAESSLAANAPRAALDASRAGLRAVRASRAAEERRLGDSETRRLGVSAPGDSETVSDRAGAAERRLRLVAAESLLALGQFADAAAALRAIVPPSPRTLRGLAVAAAGSTASGVPAEDAANEETALLRRAAAEAPEAPRPLAELGWAMLRAGGDGAAGRARRALERAAELAAANSDAAATPDSDVDFAESAPPDVAARLGAARWEETRDASRGPGTAHRALLAAAAAEGPWRASAFARLARVYAASGDASRAEKCRARALSLDPSDPVAGPDACVAAAERGDASAAAATCRRALEASPRCLWAAVRIAPAAAAAGDFETAAATLRAVLRAQPRSAEAWEALGAAYDATHRHSAALKAYARALQLEEEKEEKTTRSSETILRGGDRPRARVYSAVRSGIISRTLGRLDDAAASHERALAADPTHPAAALGLADAELARATEAARAGPGRAVAAAERAAAAARRAAPGRASMKRLRDAFLVAAARDVATAKPTKKKKKTIRNRSHRTDRVGTDRLVGDSAWCRGVAARVASRDPSASRARARRRWRRTTPPREGTSPRARRGGGAARTRRRGCAARRGHSRTVSSRGSSPPPRGSRAVDRARYPSARRRRRGRGRGRGRGERREAEGSGATRDGARPRRRARAVPRARVGRPRSTLPRSRRRREGWWRRREGRARRRREGRARRRREGRARQRAR